MEKYNKYLKYITDSQDWNQLFECNHKCEWHIIFMSNVFASIDAFDRYIHHFINNKKHIIYCSNCFIIINNDSNIIDYLNSITPKEFMNRYDGYGYYPSIKNINDKIPNNYEFIDMQNIPFQVFFKHSLTWNSLFFKLLPFISDLNQIIYNYLSINKDSIILDNCNVTPICHKNDIYCNIHNVKIQNINEIINDDETNPDNSCSYEQHILTITNK